MTLRCCEEKLRFDKSITRFVLPIGATVNMDGGAVFFATTPVYIAQLSGISLGFVKDLKVTGDDVAFSIELTTPACPVKDLLKSQAEPVFDLKTCLSIYPEYLNLNPEKWENECTKSATTCHF